MILTALTEANELFTITSQSTREELQNMRKSMTFVCPQCENPVHLKIGQVMIPHFAHIVLSNCLTSFSERESPTHLKGKLQLAEFFRNQEVEVFVESYLPKIVQRPDLLVHYKRKKFAIEFQCSVIPTQIMDNRSNGYRKIGITPIWLLHSFDLPPIPQHGITSLQLSGFRQKFIEHHSTFGSYLITYDPKNEQFIYISHLKHIKGNRFIGKVRNLPNKLQSFPFMLMKPLTIEESAIYWGVLKHQRQHFLRSRIFTNRKGVNDILLRACYEFQISPENLPLFFGLPVTSSAYFSNSLVEWQVDFIYQSLKNHIDLSEISDVWIESFVKSSMNIIDVGKGIEVLNEYVKILRKLEVKFDSFTFKQKISEEKILNAFHGLMVAKRYEY
ncbi:MAG: competence protein CoiA [Paenisporosarcina sp.]